MTCLGEGGSTNVSRLTSEHLDTPIEIRSSPKIKHSEQCGLYATPVLEGDPTPFVLSTNIHRRNLTQGQRAMAVAMLRRAPEKRGRGNKSGISANFTGVALRRVNDARVVLAHSSELAQAVMSGDTPLEECSPKAEMLSPLAPHRLQCPCPPARKFQRARMFPRSGSRCGAFRR